MLHIKTRMLHIRGWDYYKIYIRKKQATDAQVIRPCASMFMRWSIALRSQISTLDTTPEYYMF